VYHKPCFAQHRSKGYVLLVRHFYVWKYVPNVEQHANYCSDTLELDVMQGCVKLVFFSFAVSVMKENATVHFMYVVICQVKCVKMKTLKPFSAEYHTVDGPRVERDCPNHDKSSWGHCLSTEQGFTSHLQ